MQIAILLFDDITALDAVGPYEVLSRIPGATVSWVSSTPGLKKAKGGLRFVADSVLAKCQVRKSSSCRADPVLTLS
jgi:putative intracellular protease/amidase